MEILFNENVPWELADCFPAHFEVFFSQRSASQSKPNGQMLRTANRDAYDGLITKDKQMEHQQPQPPPLPVFVLSSAHQRDYEYLGDLLRSYVIPALEQGAEKRYHKLGSGFDRPDYVPNLPGIG